MFGSCRQRGFVALPFGAGRGHIAAIPQGNPYEQSRNVRCLINSSKVSRRTVLQAGALAPFAALVPADFAQAQAYPTKPIRFILPFGAGGVADTTSRLVAEKLGDKLGQRFVVENMPGAGGISAARAAIQAGNDGYAMLLMTNGTAISVPLFKTLPFDPLKDFVPVSSIGTFECLFLVNGSSPYKTLEDWIKAAREKPGTLNIGTITAGSTQHLTAELFKSSAKLELRASCRRAPPARRWSRCCATTCRW